MIHLRRVLLAVLCLALSGLPALAQAASAITTDVAPIYLRPDGSRTPLRTATKGTRLTVLATEGEWVNVEFQDPQVGRRVGWVRRSLVNISDASTTPMDLSVPPPVPIQQAGERQAAGIGQQPLPVRIVDEDETPGRGMLITGSVLLAVGLGLVLLEAAYDCNYGDFDYCSDEDQAILVGGTALIGVGGVLAAAGASRQKKPAQPRAQLRYTVRF